MRWKIEKINTFLCNLLQKQLENRKFQSGIIDILVTERYNENSLLIKWMILRGDNMELSYNSLWKILIDKKMKKETLCRKAKISTHTMSKMIINVPVALTIWLQLSLLTRGWYNGKL